MGPGAWSADPRVVTLDSRPGSPPPCLPVLGPVVQALSLGLVLSATEDPCSLWVTVQVEQGVR